MLWGLGAHFENAGWPQSKPPCGHLHAAPSRGIAKAGQRRSLLSPAQAASTAVKDRWRVVEDVWQFC